MGTPSDQSLEVRKRRRELLWVIPLALLFILLTWIEFRLFGMSRSLPFVHSVFFFGLVNFNIILFLLLFFLIFRNIVKNFAEKQGGWFGRTLKSKLILAFVSFSLIPTALMFLVSVFYINNSFDKWFSEKMAGVLKDSLEVTNAYYITAKKKNYHFADEVAKSLAQAKPGRINVALQQLRSQYSLDVVEFYDGVLGQRIMSSSLPESVDEVPKLSLELLKKGIEQRAESSTIHHFEDGNLIRVIVPMPYRGGTGAVVVSTYVPISLISKMDDIASVYEDFRDVNPLEYPLKSIYLIILVLMTLVIMLGATWFGFYLAKQLSIPLEELGEATKRVAHRDFKRVAATSGSVEVNRLISHFNKMTEQLATSESEVREANENLQQTLGRLDEHSRYIEVVLSNVSTGVISLDNKGFVTMINRHAASLLEINPSDYVGRHSQTVLSPEQYTIFSELVSSMKNYRADKIQKELNLSLKGRTIPLQVTLSLLYDDKKRELGMVLVFDDLTPVLRAQRAAAWTEVARRIAHEIKNPLTPIKLSAQRLQKKFAENISDPVFDQSIHMIIDQVDSLKSMVNEFNNFARLPKSNPQVGDLNQVINEALVLFIEAHRNITIEFSGDGQTPQFAFDPQQLKRMITNIVDNSIAAVRECPEPHIWVKTQFDNLLKIVRIEICDNGVGITQQARDRIFEPYFTTREQGTGLGLAIVKRMVEDHNGFIRALPNMPRGTKIVIELPVLKVSSVKQTQEISYES